MDAAAELGRNPVSGLNPSRETKFSGTHGDRGILIFPVQLTTSRIGYLTRLTIHTYISGTYILLTQCYYHHEEVLSLQPMYVRMPSHTYSRVWINRVRLPILIVVS